MKTSHKYLGFFLFAAIATYATIVLAGAPLKGVDIKLGMVGSERTYHAATDAEGKFSFSNLPEGTYNLFCEYTACARAINTKGTGAVSRVASPRFSLEIDRLPNVTVSAATRNASAIPALDGSSKESAYKTEITQNWNANTPALTLKVNGVFGKSKELTGHVTLIK
ncbi:MAG: carboxypeptidase-like regulatory domain-containing protein [Bacteroidota bacterium]|nr:carboxypeptidase-like regulatory domain-containing protein [Bacteroidota bacterium]MDP4233354.1 carboxypeptidase-like regulatory domain-containing protein [Bacteroidota bacterium]MDP4242221.1 carboxypeptidase-like regulatory domain-containing protein [Bacteroidota bacterium]MDP4286977.1 carboxypeptidase-like regulatory domain-containing protein [Bacteroidota bacterium]